MSFTLNIVQKPKEIYDDETLYGTRRAALRQYELNKDDASCIVLPIGTYPSGQIWNLKNITALDKRIKLMLETYGIKHALPLQRTSWPEMERSDFPFVCIAPEASGKTMCHLLYIVSKGITSIPISSEVGSDWSWSPEDTLPSLDEGLEEGPLGAILTHPKYIIISSSEQQVEFIHKQIGRLKEGAFDMANERNSAMRVSNMSPIARAISIHHEEEKLALKCNEAEILVATPGALVKCIKAGYITFSKCKKVVFDDLDITLQLHNFNVREIVKRYLIETHYMPGNDGATNKQCIMYIFMRKWTDLAEQFLASIIPQRTMIFGSITEASLFVKMQYDVEIYDDPRMRREKLLDMVKLYASSDCRSEKLAIVCNLDSEARKIMKTLSDMNYSVKYLDEGNPIDCLRANFKPASGSRKPIYLLCDEANDQLMGALADITSIIHFSLPDKMYKFDKRFKLMQGHIKEHRNEKIKLTTTIFLGPQFDLNNGRELYDMISRSTTTLPSTKLAFRDLIQENTSTICWRWACTGVCRLDKFSRDDRFGSYCLDGHYLLGLKKPAEAKIWPRSGQLKIVITHLISPNEFYFWFEAHRDKRNRTWTQLDATGSRYMNDLQQKLDIFKDTEPYSMKPSQFKIGDIYGVYSPQDLKVYRVELLEMPDIDEEKVAMTRLGVYFDEQCEVYKVDYGRKQTYYLKNLFKLPKELTCIRPMCFKAFHLGVKPSDNEAKWQHKSVRFFYDQVCVPNLRDITVWLRHNHNDTHFWVEGMKVSRRLDNIEESRLVNNEPHLDMIRAGFADKAVTEPTCLPPSIKVSTLSYWHVSRSSELATYAFLRKDKVPLPVYVLHVRLEDFSLLVRQVDFNKQLINLEDTLREDHDNKKLTPLNYFAAGVFCLAHIDMGYDQANEKKLYTINRCKILSITNQTGTDVESAECCKFAVYCLDHGDVFTVKKVDLFQAAPEHLTRLPFQAINCKFADLNPDVIKHKDLKLKVSSHIYSYTRDKNDDYRIVLCRFNAEGEVSLEVPVGKKYMSLDELLSAQNMYLLIDKPVTAAQ